MYRAKRDSVVWACFTIKPLSPFPPTAAPFSCLWSTLTWCRLYAWREREREKHVLHINHMVVWRGIPPINQNLCIITGLRRTKSDLPHRKLFLLTVIEVPRRLAVFWEAFYFCNGHKLEFPFKPDALSKKDQTSFCDQATGSDVTQQRVIQSEPD